MFFLCSSQGRYRLEAEDNAMNIFVLTDAGVLVRVSSAVLLELRRSANPKNGGRTHQSFSVSAVAFLLCLSQSHFAKATQPGVGWIEPTPSGFGDVSRRGSV
jgi:hypothetical protein